MKKLIAVAFCLLFALSSYAQQGVSINSSSTPADPSAMLDVSSASKGILIPRVALTSVNDVTTIPNPATSLLIYNTNASMVGGAIGFCYFNGIIWVQALGPQGIQGVNGNTGATGAQGSQGIPGVNGNTGTTGAQGIQGIPGVNGNTGVTGAQGSQGTPGVNGNTGATGAQGSQGIPGVNGNTGATGAQGNQGIPGVNGNTGTTGAQGIQGIPGVNGNTGVTGAQGSQGIPGVNGNTGATGAQGSQGTPGVNGNTGATGAQGIQGISGATGATGPVGCTIANTIIKSDGSSATCTLTPIFEDPTNMRIAIGTTNPNTKLDVVGGDSGSITNLLTIRSNYSANGTGSGFRLINSTSSTSNVGAEIVSLTHRVIAEKPQTESPINPNVYRAFWSITCSATPLSEIFGLREKSSPVLEVLAEQQSIYLAFC